jgi:hypothetical protein
LSSEKWHLPKWTDDFAVEPKEGMQPFSLKGTTAAQEQALRDLASQSGFKSMRGFNKWMEAADLTYYDLIKVASPE